MALRTIGYKLSVLIKRILYRKINCEYCRKAFDNFEIREKYIVEEQVNAVTKCEIVKDYKRSRDEFPALFCSLNFTTYSINSLAMSPHLPPVIQLNKRRKSAKPSSTTSSSSSQSWSLSSSLCYPHYGHCHVLFLSLDFILS